MGHFTKGQNGQVEKIKEQIMYVAKKKPKAKPPLHRKGNIRLSKKNGQWRPISKI
jgi:hypothetical protein